MTEINWHEHFYYHRGMLVWKSGARSGKWAGCIQPHGYRRVRLNGSLYYAHRIIWEMHNGAIPAGMNIDHINGDRLNNTIENLRLCDQAANMKNARKYSTNRSGLAGVYRHSVAGLWVAQITVDGRTVYIGTSDNLFDAACMRKSAEIGRGFTERHGK